MSFPSAMHCYASAMGPGRCSRTGLLWGVHFWRCLACNRAVPAPHQSVLVTLVNHWGPGSEGCTAGTCSGAQRGPRWLRGMLIVHGTCVHVVSCAPMFPLVRAHVSSDGCPGPWGELLGRTPARPAATLCAIMALVLRYNAVCKGRRFAPGESAWPLPACGQSSSTRLGWSATARRCRRALRDRRWSVAVSALAPGTGGATPLDLKSGGRMDIGLRHPSADGSMHGQVVELYPWIHAGGLVQSRTRRQAATALPSPPRRWGHGI